MAHFFAKITEHFLGISREDEITIFSQKYLDIIYQLLHTNVINIFLEKHTISSFVYFR
jgi:hypothetical protein